MLVLLILCVLAGCLIVVPLLLLGLVLRLALGLALIPLRIAGFALRFSFGLVIGLVGLILAGTLILIPLLPILALIGAIWMIARLTTGSRRASAAVGRV